MNDIVRLSQDVTVVLAGLTAIGALVYWAIKNKLKDDFCMKSDCHEKHLKLDALILSNNTKHDNDIQEIKEIVTRIEARLFDFMNKFIK